MRYTLALISLLTVSSMISCSRDYDVELPAEENRLVVECYLEDGQPMRALITESTALLDTSTIPPVIMNAVVTITHAGRTDTLRPFVYIDSARNKVYNYGSSSIVRADEAPGEPYRIDIRDGHGRHATGQTRFLTRVPIAEITTILNDDGEAACITTIADDPSVKNYYRLVLKRNSQYDSIQQNRLFNDDFADNQGNIVIRSRHRYLPGDSVHATLYHVGYEYYQFLNTSEGARSALVNPFAASGEVVSNIQGGLGIFAALSLTNRSIRVP